MRCFLSPPYGMSRNSRTPFGKDSEPPENSSVDIALTTFNIFVEFDRGCAGAEKNRQRS